MDILGVGGWEFVAIILIALVVAGPKRMIQWSYTLGKYLAQLRKMWVETAQIIQKEFDEAGVDVKVPHEIPTRGSINREVARALSPVTQPLQDSLDGVKREIDGTKQAVTEVTDIVKPPTKPKFPIPHADTILKPAEQADTPAPPDQTPPAAAPEAPPDQQPASSNGNGHSNFGTWSQPKS